jgi:hypothetical protein
MLLSISIVSISSFTYTRQPLLVAISLGGNKLLIALYFPFNVAYRSPNSMDIECIEEMREILTNSKIRNIKYGFG